MENLAAKRLKRIEKSKLNTTIALATSIIMGVLSFAERAVFNRCFIPDYLGLYSFFNNLVGIINTAELGIGTSIAFALYAPLEYGQKDQIAAIMRFFRKAYAIVGTIVLFIGLAIIPAMPFLLKTEIDMHSVYIYYLFFLFRTVTNYYFGYKEILLSANQEQYKVTLVTNMSWSVLYIAEMIISVTTGNFLYYVTAIFTVNLIRAIILNVRASRQFPELGKYKDAKIDKASINHLKKNTGGLIITRLSSVLVTTTDSILISAMVGTAFLGKYSNYQMITTGLMSISALLPQSITASIGNAGVTESKRMMSKSFEMLNLASFFIYGSLTIVLITIINPLVEIFFGPDRAMPFFSTVLVCINFYLNNQRELLLTFKSSLGLYWEDRKRPIAEGLTNLIVSIILGKYMGFDGIIIGTIITNVCVNLTIEPRVIIHNGLRTSAFWYYLSITGRFLFAMAITVVSLYASSFVPIDGIAGLLAKALIAVAITGLAFCIVYRKDENARAIFRTLKLAFSKKRNPQ